MVNYGGWGGFWGVIPWGGVRSAESAIVQKIVLMLRGSSDVTKFTGAGTGARIFGGHLMTIDDRILPAVSVEMMLSPGRETSPCNFDIINYEISIYMSAVGKQGYVWDDMMECYSGIIETLHRQQAFDKYLGAKVIALTNQGDGPQIMLQDGVMKYPSQWQAFAESAA